MPYVDLISTVHRSTRRDYLGRVNEFPKAEAAKLAKKFDVDYWDGDRKVGYGGYKYDGRWRAVADAMVQQYMIKPGETILDVGCGKGFLMYDLMQAVPGLKVTGIDVSHYGLTHSQDEVRPFVSRASAAHLPFPDSSFDLVISINTLHNLYCYDLDAALREIERVGRKDRYICVESYRNEDEKTNLLYWQLTCEMFCTPQEWEWWFERTGYSGDYSFIYFE
jgi:protein-L-isoaspartate(D-aspartate) O-methyltransferase